MWNGAGKRAFFGYHRGAGGEIYWFTNEPRAQEPAREAPGREDETSEEQPFIREIIAGAEDVFPAFPSYALPTQPAAWHAGPVVLAGDAAHAISPSSGQGAAMALEDAATLAKCLRDIPDRARRTRGEPTGRSKRLTYYCQLTQPIVWVSFASTTGPRLRRTGC